MKTLAPMLFAGSIWMPLAALAHCVESPGVTCVDAPCHHPNSPECRGAQQAQEALTRTVTETAQVAATPAWQRVVGTVLDIIVPAQNAAAETYTVPKIKNAAAALSALADETSSGKSKGQPEARDPLVRLIPPPPGQEGPRAASLPPSKEVLQRGVLDAARDVSNNAAIIRTLSRTPPPLPPGLPEAAATAPIPPEFLKRHTVRLGSAYEQLIWAAAWSNKAEGQPLPPTVFTNDLTTSLERMKNQLNVAIPTR